MSAIVKKNEQSGIMEQKRNCTAGLRVQLSSELLADKQYPFSGSKMVLVPGQVWNFMRSS